MAGLTELRLGELVFEGHRCVLARRGLTVAGKTVRRVRSVTDHGAPVGGGGETTADLLVTLAASQVLGSGGKGEVGFLHLGDRVRAVAGSARGVFAGGHRLKRQAGVERMLLACFFVTGKAVDRDHWLAMRRALVIEVLVTVDAVQRPMGGGGEHRLLDKQRELLARLAHGEFGIAVTLHAAGVGVGSRFRWLRRGGHGSGSGGGWRRGCLGTRGLRMQCPEGGKQQPECETEAPRSLRSAPARASNEGVAA